MSSPTTIEHPPLRTPHRSRVVIAIIIYKYVMGVLEFFSGLTLTMSSVLGFAAARFIDPLAIVRALTAGELSEDPHDLFANWILAQTPGTLLHDALNVGLVLLLIGCIKLLIATALVLKSSKLHAGALLLVALLTITSMIGFITHMTVLRGLAVVIEIIVLYYLVREIPREFEHTAAA